MSPRISSEVIARADAIVKAGFQGDYGQALIEAQRTMPGEHEEGRMDFNEDIGVSRPDTPAGKFPTVIHSPGVLNRILGFEAGTEPSHGPRLIGAAIQHLSAIGEGTPRPATGTELDGMGDSEIKAWTRDTIAALRTARAQGLDPMGTRRPDANVQ